MALFHLHGDESGATRLARLEMGIEESPVGAVRGMLGIPATAMSLCSSYLESRILGCTSHQDDSSPSY